MVLGSSDKSEYLMGYFTKYGDGASDLVPIISLYKLQVREIAKFLGVPQSVIEKRVVHIYGRNTKLKRN